MQQKIGIFVFLSFLSFSLYGQTIEITGKVVDKITKKGIEEAVIIVFPSGKKTTSKPNGNFSLEVEEQPGMFVQIMKSGYDSIKITQNFSEIYAELTLSTQVEGQKVTVQGKKDQKKVVVSKQKIEEQIIEKSTATLFGDAIKVIQTMPGVVTTNEFSALMYIRGGDAYEIMNYYNRMLLINAYVWGGILTVFNPDIIQSIDFYSGAFPAEYGNAMSGVLDAKIKDGRVDRIGGFFDLSATTFTALIEGPLGERGHTNSSFLVAVRRTHYDLAMKMMVQSGILEKEKYEGVKMPFFYDAHLHFKIQLNDSHFLRLASLIVYEGADVSFEATGATEEESREGWKAGNEFHYKDFRYLQGISLTSLFSNEILLENNICYSIETGDYKYVDTYSPVHFQSSFHFFQYQADLTLKPNKNHRVKIGLGFYSLLMDMDYTIILNRIPKNYHLIVPPGNITKNQVPNYVFTNHIDGKIYTIPTFFIQDDMELVKDFLFLNTGFRSEYFNINKTFTADPRIGLKINWNEIFSTKIAGGIYSQQIADGSWYDDKNGNPNLKPQKSYHGVISLEREDNDYFFRIDTFYKLYRDLVNADYKEKFKNGSIGFSYGFDIFLQKKIGGNWDGYLSYTYVITQRKVIDRITKEEYNATISDPSQYKGDYDLYPQNNKWYFPHFDRRHSINLVLNYNFTKDWKLGTTFKFGTGLPYTPLVGRTEYTVIDDNNRKMYGPIEGEFNSARLPFYYNLDIKLTMPFFLEKWSSFIQLYNLLDLMGLEKIEGYYYDETYTKRREQKGLPFFIIIGIRGEF